MCPELPRVGAEVNEKGKNLAITRGDVTIYRQLWHGWLVRGGPESISINSNLNFTDEMVTILIETPSASNYSPPTEASGCFALRFGSDVDVSPLATSSIGRGRE
jgi:hypothetical protein